MAGLIRGDRDAFEAVFREYHGRLFTFLARLSRQRDLAEDLAHEAWLRLARNAHRLAPDTNISAWLFTVGRNVYVSACRSRALEQDHGTELIGLWPAASRRPSPFESAAASELEGQLERAIARLPLLLREAILLVSVEGFTPAEAARMCDVSPEAMRQRLARARARLLETIERTVCNDERPY